MEKNPAWPPTLPHLLEACTSPLEKELVWAVGSPALMGCQAPGIERHLTAGFFEAARLDLDQWIHDAERTPRAEAEVLGSKAMRLGHRFERLIQWWFHEHPEWTVHAQNEVVQLGKHTAGEIDLLAERNGEWTHFELACKFYLSARRSSQWTSWIGLDPKDSLDQKLTVFQRQIELTQREEVRAVACGTQVASRCASHLDERVVFSAFSGSISSSFTQKSWDQLLCGLVVSPPRLAYNLEHINCLDCPSASALDANSTPQNRCHFAV